MVRSGGGKGKLTKDGYVVPSRAKETRGPAEQVNAANNKLVKENNQLREDNDRLIDEVQTLTSRLEGLEKATTSAQRLEDIRAALDMLDHANNAQWTDDGLVRVEMVCEIMGDDTVKREDIETASQGFVRVKPTVEV